MKYNLIVACDKDYGIGKEGTIPWHFKKDMEFFRRTTTGPFNKNAVVMGYNTWVSLPKALPNRVNFVLSRNNADKIKPQDNVIVCRSLEEFKRKASGFYEIFVIGGSVVYDLFLKEERKNIKTIYITHLTKSYDCDTFFSFKKLKPKQDMVMMKDNGSFLFFAEYQLRK